MKLIELENGNWINPDFIEEIYKINQLDTHWQAGMNHGEAVDITDTDRVRIIKAVGFLNINNNENDEQGD